MAKCVVYQLELTMYAPEASSRVEPRKSIPVADVGRLLVARCRHEQRAVEIVQVDNGETIGDLIAFRFAIGVRDGYRSGDRLQLRTDTGFHLISNYPTTFRVADKRRITICIETKYDITLFIYLKFIYFY